MARGKKTSSEDKVKNPNGRPSKIENFLPGMEKALNEGINAIILTDEELFIEANEHLEEKYRICYTTFKNYKASEKKEEKELFQKFLSLYKKALLKQKKNLFQKLQGETSENDKYQNQWQKYAWIIERKFDDWNLRNINDNSNANVDITEELDEEQKKKIASRFK